MHELRPGVWHWQSPHPDWNEEGCYVVRLRSGIQGKVGSLGKKDSEGCTIRYLSKDRVEIQVLERPQRDVHRGDPVVMRESPA
jgi:hypothetical protein